LHHRREVKRLEPADMGNLYDLVNAAVVSLLYMHGLG
jgi:hypothetical protein